MQKKQRRNIVASSPYSSNTLSFRSPWIALWWSVAFPGFGHFTVSSYLWGFFLMSFEYLVNTVSHINTAIYYTMTGHFEMAKEAISLKLLFLYVTVYVFAMWDAYRRAVDMNKTYQLAYRQTQLISPLHATALEINILEKKKPWVSFVWSFLMPGCGYIYLQRIPAAFFGFFWWIVVVYKSNLFEGVLYSFFGDFARAVSALDPQWLLYVPSIYGFAMYNTYSMAVDNNKIFEIELSRFLKVNFQRGSLDDFYEPCN